MFESLTGGAREKGDRRRWSLSLVLATIAYGGLVASAFALGGGEPKPVEREEAIEVAFAPPPEPEPPAPPPPPEPEPVAPEPPPAAPPPVAAPEHLKRKAPDPAQKPRDLVQPEKISEEKPEEKDASEFAVAAAPPGEGDAAGREGGTGEPGTQVASIEPDAKPKGTGKPRRRKPVQLTERMTPPKQLTTTRPSFPEAARTAGKNGEVIMKIVVDEKGSVVWARLVRGEEPFVSAAASWVRTLRFEPARDPDGLAIAVFRTLRIPFELRNI